MQNGFGAGSHAHSRYGLRAAEGQRQRLFIEKELNVVIGGLLSGKRQLKDDIFLARRGILKRIGSVEINFVGAEPEQTLLAVIDVKCGGDAAGLQGNRLGMKNAFLAD